MQCGNLVRPQRLVVQHDADIITLRQEVRHTARLLGLNLTQQAKLCAAASGLARSFLLFREKMAVTIQLNEQGEHRALEIISLWPGKSADPAQLELSLELKEMRVLVSEAAVSAGTAGTEIVLRMWLP